MRKNKVLQCCFISLLILTLIVFASAQEQNKVESAELSGGSYVIAKSVVAGGGKQSQQAPSEINGTSGQSVAGYNSSGGQFSLYSGFWTPENAAPTAAFCVVSGQILNSANQKALYKVTVSITGGTNMITRTTTTDREGKFTFVDIEAGGFYIVTVERRGYWFTPSNIAFNLLEDKQDVNFSGSLNVN